MNHGNPPRVATWIFEYLRPSGCDDALAGDLLEEFRSGRSAGWYWLQIIAALAVEWGQRAWQQRNCLLFAAAWSFVSPSWVFFDFRSRDLLWRTGFVWYIPPWPWRLVCFLVLGLVEAVLLISLGVLAYVVFDRLVFGKLHLPRLGIGILWDVVVSALAGTLVAYALAGAFGLLAHPRFIHGPDLQTLHTLTLLGVIGDFRIWAIAIRLTYFLGTASALWFLTSTELNPVLLGWSVGRTCARGLLNGISRLREWPDSLN
jgi:hypothetical protein